MEYGVSPSQETTKKVVFTPFLLRSHTLTPHTLRAYGVRLLKGVDIVIFFVWNDFENIEKK